MLENAGFRIVSGRTRLNATVLEIKAEFLKSLPEGERARIAEAESHGSVFLGCSNDRGKGVMYTTKAESADLHLGIIQAKLDIPGLLTKMKLGREVFRYARMRYVVAEKPKG